MHCITHTWCLYPDVPPISCSDPSQDRSTSHRTSWLLIPLEYNTKVCLSKEWFLSTHTILQVPKVPWGVSVSQENKGNREAVTPEGCSVVQFSEVNLVAITDRGRSCWAWPAGDRAETSTHSRGQESWWTEEQLSPLSTAQLQPYLLPQLLENHWGYKRLLSPPVTSGFGNSLGFPDSNTCFFSRILLNPDSNLKLMELDGMLLGVLAMTCSDAGVMGRRALSCELT